MTDTQRFTSVWDALENTPQEAASIKARSALMMALAEVIRERGMTQGKAAVTCPQSPYQFKFQKSEVRKIN